VDSGTFRVEARTFDELYGPRGVAPKAAKPKEVKTLESIVERLEGEYLFL